MNMSSFDLIDSQKTASQPEVEWHLSQNFPQVYSADKKFSKISIANECSKDYFLIAVEKVFSFKYGLRVYNSLLLGSNVFSTLSRLIKIFFRKTFAFPDDQSISMQIVFLFIDLWNLVLTTSSLKVDRLKLVNELEEIWDGLGIGHKSTVISSVRKDKHHLLLGIKLLAITLIISSFHDVLIYSHLGVKLSFFAILLQLSFLFNSLLYISTMFQLVMLCISIRSSFIFLQSRFRSSKDKGMDVNALRNYRTIFAKTIDMIRKANACWRQIIFFYYVFIVIINVTTLYNLFYAKNSFWAYFNSLVLLCFGAVSLFIVTYSVSGLNHYAIKIYPDIYRLTLGNRSEEFLIEVSLCWPIIKAN